MTIAMNSHPCPLASELPSLDDETAALMIDALQQVVLLIEEHYSAQIRRHYQEISHADLFDPPISTADGTAPF